MDKNNRRKFIKELGLISMGTFVLPGLNLTAKGLAQATGMNIPGGIASCAGVTKKGWYAVSLVFSDENKHTLSDTIVDSSMGFEERGNLLQEWMSEQQKDCSAKLLLTTSWQSSANKELACEKSILFPVSPREKTAYEDVALGHLSPFFVNII